MTQNSDGFTQLWPTLFLQRQLPSADIANQALRQFLMMQDDSQAQLTTDYRQQNLFEQTHPALQWLHQCINKTIADYLSRSGVSVSIQWQLQGWANINRQGDYHGLHNHPHSYLSGTYYVDMPEQPLSARQRDDLNPGDISFFDPRPQANMSAIAGDPQIDPEHRVTPAAGLLLLWPSFVHHAVHPNFAEQPRVSISFNVVLRRSETLLPDQ
ncbi:2OG-Fe(II) oxygenase family protein [Granulosicoccus sp. 3-233]|uniref:2OG-Fe(II) oxygenase family protein n=1 Tax=Granulosicoccus sp. 3-233 TaxID=3417969 RepID=UPI003D32555B